MDQKTKIILGIVLLGGAYYLYTRKKREGDNLCYDRNGKIRNLTESERMQAVVRECYDKNGNTRKVKTKNIELPKSYDNTSNCENQFKDYERKQNMMKVVREPKTPEQYQAYKQNWINQNCKLKM